MTQLPMPRGKPGSPIGTLTASITDTDTTIPFDTAILPDDVPNICTIFIGDAFESIWYIEKNAGNVVCESAALGRGVDGTTARSWDAGTEVARFVCEYDFYSRAENIKEHETILEDALVVEIADDPIDNDIIAYDAFNGVFINKSLEELGILTSEHDHDLEYAAITHASTHKSGGADSIKLDELSAPTDVTTLDASTSKHGLLIKAMAPGEANDRCAVVIDTGETGYKCTSIYSDTTSADLGTASSGTSKYAARRDHVHDMPSAADVGAAAVDHTHEDSGGISVWTSFSPFSRASDSSFTVTDNAANQEIFRTGRPLRYSDTEGSWIYGVVVGYSSGTVTIAGTAMTTSYDGYLQYGLMSNYIQMNIFIPGFYEDATNTSLISSDLGQTLEWIMGKAYIVAFRPKTRVADSSSNGYVNISVASGNLISGNGIVLDTTGVKNAGVTINQNYYGLDYGEVIELLCTKGTSGDAVDLTVTLGIVLA